MLQFHRSKYCPGMNLLKGLNVNIFSSNEHELLEVSYWDRPSTSVSCAVIRQHFALNSSYNIYILTKLHRNDLAQSVTCLATDACLTVDPGVVSSIKTRSHTFVEIGHQS